MKNLSTNCFFFFIMPFHQGLDNRAESFSIIILIHFISGYDY